MTDDDTTTFELTRRRILGGALTVGAASAATGAGTLALFSDTEQSSGNTVSAGTLDLTVDGDNDATTTLSVGGSAVKPGASGSGATTLANAGSIDGVANFDVSPVELRENGQTEPEQSVDDSGGDPGAGSGELGGLLPGTWSTLDVRYGFDTTGDGAIDVPVVDTFGKTFEPLRRTGGAEYNPNQPVGSGDSVDFVVEWTVPSDVGNAVQTDEVSFDVTFELLQEPSGRDVVLTGESPYSDAKGFDGSFTPSDATGQVGDGSWQADPDDQVGLYFGGGFSGYHALPSFTVGDIAELGYWMNHSNSSVQTDFFLQIFTAPKNDGTDLGGFYNARLTAVPPNANDGSPVWNPGEWNEFSTDANAQNQLYFYLEDNQSVSTTPRTLSKLQSNPFESGGNTYGAASDDVFALALLTNSTQSGFTGYLDDISLSLTSGETLSIDLEP